MSKRYRVHTFLLIIFIILITSTISAQIKNIQFKVSGFNTSSYQRIKSHTQHVLAITFFITKSACLCLESGYYQDKYYWNERNFEYCGTSYTSRNAQLWRDHSLLISVLFSTYKNFYFGAGIGFDRIYITRILFSGWRSFWVDPQDNVIAIFKEEEEKKKISFAGSFMFGWEQPFWRNFSRTMDNNHFFYYRSQITTPHIYSNYTILTPLGSKTSLGIDYQTQINGMSHFSSSPQFSLTYQRENLLSD